MTRRSKRPVREADEPAFINGNRELVSLELPYGLREDSTPYKWSFEFNGRMVSQVWYRKMSNGHRLNHPANANWLEVSQRYFVAKRNALFNSGSELALSSVLSQTSTVISICDFMISEGRSSLSEMSPSLWAKLLEKLEETGLDLAGTKVITPARVEHIFAVLDDLNRMYVIPIEDGRFLLNDGVPWKVFSSFEDALALAKRIGKAEAKHVDDIPKDTAFAFINAAIEYVMYYAKYILELRALQEEESERIVGPSRARPGEKVAALAKFLLTQIDGHGVSKIYFKAGKFILARVAGRIKIDVTSIYQERYISLIRLCEQAISGADVSVDAVREKFTALADASDSKGRPPIRDRSLAAKLGLPFSPQDAEVGEAAPWPICHVGSSSKNIGTSIEDVTLCLWSAAYIIILAFMGDRAEEGMQVDVDCIVDRVDGPYLRTLNFKTHDSEAGTYIEQPCPSIVVEAVRVLTALGEDARSKNGSTKLFFISHRNGESLADNSSLRKRLKRFGEITGASKTLNGKPWVLKPSQLRRFFVTMWVHYYDFGGRFEALRRHLDHRWLTTTLGYGRSKDGAIMSEMQNALTFSVFHRAALEGLELKGGAGARFLKLLDQIKVTILPEDGVADWLRSRIGRLGVYLTPMAWGYCVWSVLAGAHAKCVRKEQRRRGLIRPRGRKRWRQCIHCANFCCPPQFFPFFQFSKSEHASIASNPAAPPRLRSVAKQAVKIIKSVFGF